MRRFDGNSVLVVAAEMSYGMELCQVLSNRGAQVSVATHFEKARSLFQEKDFDLVVCSYYLPDGLILQLIDWCRKRAAGLPLFVALGSSMPADERLLHRHLISGVFLKHETGTLLETLHNLLFDFKEFEESMLEMVEERGILLEAVVPGGKYAARPIELTSEGIFLSFEGKYEQGASGLLRFNLFEGRKVETFALMGSFSGSRQGPQHFKVNEVYEKTWKRLLTTLEEKQVKINGFLNKVSGD